MHVVGRNPAFADQALLRNVHVEHVHHMVNRFDLLHYDDPLRKFLGYAHQNSLTLIFRLIDDHIQIFQANLNTLQHVFAFFVMIRARIKASVIARTNFLNTRLQLFALKESDEDVFENFFTLKYLSTSIIVFRKFSSHVFTDFTSLNGVSISA